MRNYPLDKLNALVSFFRKVPGIGERNALRFSLYFATLSPKMARDFARLLLKAVDELQRCRECWNLCEDELCWVCRDKLRNRTYIAVVESVMDLYLLEDAGFDGLYQVVGGAVSDTRRVTDSDRRSALQRLKRQIEKYSVKEVILTFPFTVKGDSLARFFHENLKNTVRISRIGRGIPTGGDITYMDRLTLLSSLKRREKL